jgi:hypothetical protein
MNEILKRLKPGTTMNSVLKRMPSRALRHVLSKSPSWFDDDADSDDEQIWNETPAERSSRIAKKKVSRRKSEENLKDQRKQNVQMCGQLVEELFVCEVHRIASYREAVTKAKNDGVNFAKAAALKRFTGGVVWNQNQNVSGGPLAVTWNRKIIPRKAPATSSDPEPNSHSDPHKLKAQPDLPFSRAHHGGDWISKVSPKWPSAAQLLVSGQP